MLKHRAREREKERGLRNEKQRRTSQCLVGVEVRRCREGPEETQALGAGISVPDGGRS